MDSPYGKDDKCTTMTDSGQVKSISMNKQPKNVIVQTPKLRQKFQLGLNSQFKKTNTVTLPNERSPQHSTDRDLFNDQYLIENNERKLEQVEKKHKQFKNLLLGRRQKTSTDHFFDFQEQTKKELETGYAKMHLNFIHCHAALTHQRQNLMNNELALQEYQRELENLKEQLSTIQESIKLTQGQDRKSMNDLVYKVKLKQIKEKQLTHELYEYISGLQHKYHFHIQSFKDYLFMFKQQINEVMIETEYFEKL